MERPALCANAGRSLPSSIPAVAHTTADFSLSSLPRLRGWPRGCEVYRYVGIGVSPWFRGFFVFPNPHGDPYAPCPHPSADRE